MCEKQATSVQGQSLLHLWWIIWSYMPTKSSEKQTNASNQIWVSNTFMLRSVYHCVLSWHIILLGFITHSEKSEAMFQKMFRSSMRTLSLPSLHVTTRPHTAEIFLLLPLSKTLAEANILVNHTPVGPSAWSELLVIFPENVNSCSSVVW
jgi:hypothetical protein